MSRLRQDIRIRGLPDTTRNTSYVYTISFRSKVGLNITVIGTHNVLTYLLYILFHGSSSLCVYCSNRYLLTVYTVVCSSVLVWDIKGILVTSNRRLSRKGHWNILYWRYSLFSVNMNSEREKRGKKERENGIGRRRRQSQEMDHPTWCGSLDSKDSRNDRT